MIWSRPRHLLALCAGLDLVGVALVAVLIDRWTASDLWRHPHWLLSYGFTYVLLSWLFGSYTLLRWARLRAGQVMVRLGISALATTLAVVLAYWLFNLPETFTLGHRRNQLLLVTGLTFWALTIRLTLHRIARDRQMKQPYATLLERAESQQQRLLPALLPDQALTLGRSPGPMN
jgi:hypothetical protein